MRYFADDLERRCRAGGADAATAHLRRCASQSRRMTQMLTDLLDYSRIGRKDEALERVDTGALVARDRRVDAAPRRASRSSIARRLAGGRAPRRAARSRAAQPDRQRYQAIMIATEGRSSVVQPSAELGPSITVRTTAPASSRWHEAIFEPFRTHRRTGNAGQQRHRPRPGPQDGGDAGGKLTLVSEPALRRGTKFKSGTGR